MILLKLLGIGKFLREFFLDNWKWIVPLLLVFATFLWTKNHYYDLGVEKTRAEWEAKVEAERKKNEALTQKLIVSVQDFGKAAEARNETRLVKENTHETRINTIIEEKPIYTECKVDEDVLTEQNAIKALGPKL